MWRGIMHRSEEREFQGRRPSVKGAGHVWGIAHITTHSSVWSSQKQWGGRWDAINPILGTKSLGVMRLLSKVWPCPAEETDVGMTRKAFLGRTQHQSWQKSNPMETRPESQDLWSAKGQATVMNTVPKIGPGLEAACQGLVSTKGSLCGRHSVWGQELVKAQG